MSRHFVVVSSQIANQLLSALHLQSTQSQIICMYHMLQLSYESLSVGLSSSQVKSLVVHIIEKTASKHFC